MNKRKIKESTKPKKEANERNKPFINENGKIMIDFSYPFVFHTCMIKNNFINKLKDPRDFFINKRIIFGEALDHFSKHTFFEITSDNNHSHSIQEKQELIRKILKEILAEYKPTYRPKDIEQAINNYIGDEDIWQLAYKKGIRMIGTRNGSVLKLLFIDYHHLIIPDKNHNAPDYYKYTFCPMTSELLKK